MAKKHFGEAYAATAYLIRHLKHGIRTDCVYLEKPSDQEMRDVCGAADVEAGLVRAVETTLVSERDELSPMFDLLDPWEPPPLPTGVSESADGKELVFKVKISGTGIVKNPGE